MSGDLTLGHISNIEDIVKLGGAVFTDQDTDKALDAIPKEVRLDFQNHIFSAQFWKRIENTHTPLDLIKERKGPWSSAINDHVKLEYFPEEYTIQELNRLFPGWWNEDMDDYYNEKLRTIRIKGYLCVEIPSLQGKQVVKRWAIGAVTVEVKKPKKTRDMTEEEYEYLLGLGPQPSQPDDRYKAARTEWIKLAGKWYGIGLEIYHQRITPEMKSHFEDIVRPLGKYGSEFKDIAATLETGHKFRDYLKELPTITQVRRVTEAVSKIPDGTLNKEEKDVRSHVMSTFVLHNNDGNANREKFEKFLINVEQAALHFQNQTKEATNE